MSYEDQRRHYEQLNADRAVVEQAAARLRHQAIVAGYAGLEHKELAFGVAPGRSAARRSRPCGPCTATICAITARN